MFTNEFILIASVAVALIALFLFAASLYLGCLTGGERIDSFEKLNKWAESMISAPREAEAMQSIGHERFDRAAAIKAGAAALKREAAWVAADLTGADAERCAAAVIDAISPPNTGIKPTNEVGSA